MLPALFPHALRDPMTLLVFIHEHHQLTRHASFLQAKSDLRVLNTAASTRTPRTCCQSVRLEPELGLSLPCRLGIYVSVFAQCLPVPHSVIFLLCRFSPSGCWTFTRIRGLRDEVLMVEIPEWSTEARLHGYPCP